jgi:hypothetical protein
MGHTGNAMFQYAFSRLLSERLGMKLFISDKEMASIREFFPNLAKLPDGKVVLAPIWYFGELSIKHLQHVSINELADGNKDCGFDITGYFERSDFYLSYRDTLINWFKLDTGKNINYTVMNIRAGQDYSYQLEQEKDYYSKALEIAGGDAVIVTDDPTNAFVKSFKLPIYHYNPIDDFKLMLSAKKLIVGRSTFSWWAAFLGRAEQVIQPEPQHGFRSKEHYWTYLGVPYWTQVII